MREAKTNCSVIVRGNSILIRSESHFHPLLIANPDQLRDEKSVIRNTKGRPKFIVAGYGEETSDKDEKTRLDIGDVVYIPQVPFNEVSVPENSNSLEAVSELYKSLSNDEITEVIKKGEYVLIVKYLLFSDFQIPAIYEKASK